MSDGDRPDEIWTTATDRPAPRRLTTSNPQLDDVALTRSELVEYLDVDGNTLYGILYYPAGYVEGRTYPLVAEIYEQFFDNGFNENMNLITAQGWFGFRPSVRFEEGFPGEAWFKAVPNAINKIIELGLVDPDKVGVYGQSYGGYATNLLITQTDRFRGGGERLRQGEHHLVPGRFAEDHHAQLRSRGGRAGPHRGHAMGAAAQVHRALGGDVRGPDRDAAAHAVGRGRLERAGHEPARDVLRAAPPGEGGRVGALHGGRPWGRAREHGDRLRGPLAADVRLVRRALRGGRGAGVVAGRLSA